MMNYINLKNIKNDSPKAEFFSEKIKIDPVDYYYSNVIARSSNTMSECRNKKIKVKSTGTDG